MSANNNGVPEHLRDEYFRVKVAIAVVCVCVIIGVTICVAAGYIPMTNPVAEQILPLFNLLVGLVIGFMFRNGVRK